MAGCELSEMYPLKPDPRVNQDNIPFYNLFCKHLFITTYLPMDNLQTRARILVQVTIYRRPLIDQSEAYDIS